MNTKKVGFKESSPSDSQPPERKKTHESKRLTTSFGSPIGDRTIVTTADSQAFRDLRRSNRESIPKRIVHARGTGAFGVFEATDDISNICKAKVFKMGMKTRVLVRFSTSDHQSNSADKNRPSRGFAVKMYTDEGIWDLVGSNLPVFSIRNPSLFSSLVRAQNRNPQTHLIDSNMFWNFLANHPQAVHYILLINSDRGLPNSFRFMHGYGSHTFKMINDKNEFVWVKFHLRSDKNIKNLDPKTAKVIAGEQPDCNAADLSSAIASKNYPSWTLYIQVMTEEQAKNCSFDPFDLTKVFSQKEYPLHKVGKLTLNENPTDYFCQIEQAAFNPAHMPPGIEASPDKILQMRLSAYASAHLGRVGPNNLLIPVNNPETNKNAKVCTCQRNGFMQTGANSGSCPVHHDNLHNRPVVANRNVHIERGTFKSDATGRHMMPDEDDYSQPRNFYRNVLDSKGRASLINNIAESLAQCTDKNVVCRVLNVLANVDNDFGRKLAEKIKL